MRSRSSQFKSQCRKKKNTQKYNQNNTTPNPSAPQLNTCYCLKWKPESPWQSSRVQDLKSRSPQFKYQSVQKENLSQIQSEQYHHHPSALELNTWNWQRWEIEITMAQWQSADLKVKRFPFQISVWGKRKSLTDLIKTIPQLFPLHHS